MDEIVFGLAGWVVAAFCLALYLGERGRRKDLAYLTAMSVEEKKAAVMTQKDPEEKAREVMDEEGLQRLTDDIVARTGADPKIARQEAERMRDEVARMGGGW